MEAVRPTAPPTVAPPGPPASAAALEAIAGHLADLVSLVSADGRILRQFGGRQVSGYAPAERVGRPILELVHPEDRALAHAWLERLAGARPGTPPAELDLRQRHASGVWHPVRMRGTNLLGDPAIGALLIEEHDESERHYTQLSAERMRDRLHLVAQGVRMGFFEYDVVANRFEFSNECWTMRGLVPPAERGALGPEVLDEIHAEDRGPGLELLARVIAGPGDDWDAEYRVPTANGEWMWIQQRAHVLARDAAGRATRIAGVLLDVDRRKRAERGLVHSEARYRTIVAMTPGFVHESVLAEDGSMLMRWASEGFARLLGWSVAELNERGGWRSIVHPEHRGPAAQRKGRAFGGEPAHGETRLLSKSGQWLWFDVSLFPLQEPETGAVVSAMGMLYDITNRKHAEEQLRASEERFRLAAAAVKGVIYERDLASGMVRCSAGVAEVLGLGDEAQLQPLEWWLARVHPEDAAQFLSDRGAPASDGVVTSEYRLRLGTGQYAEVLDRAIVACDENGRPVRTIGCAMDVTEMRRTERLLREAEALAHVGSWQLDVGSGELTFSDEARRIAGVGRDEAPGDLRSMFDYIAPGSAPAVRAAIERALATGESYQLDVELARRDGTRRWLRTSGRAEVAEGRTVRLYGAFQDIDALKRGELRLREQGETLRLAMDSGQLAAWRWNPRSDALTVDYRSPGFDPGIAFAPTLAEDLATIAPEYRGPARRHMQHTITSGEPVEFELKITDAGGGPRWLRSRLMRAETADGPVVIGTSVEVTARRIAEDAMRASEAMLRSVTDNSPDLIAIVDGDLRIRFVNRPLRGEPPERIVGRPAADFTDASAEFESRLRDVLGSGRPLRFESRAPREDGSDGLFEYRLGPVHEGGRISGVIVYSTDITERRALEREILEISNREQRRIGSDLHDGLGQELTGIALMLDGVSSAARRGVAPRSAELRELTALVRGAIEQTRTLARGLSPVALDGGGLVHALRALVARTREMYGLDIRFRSRVAPRVTLDAAATGHLYRIAQESLTNAARHAAAHTVLVQFNVTGRRVALAISDDGRGLGPGSSTGVGLKIMRYRANMLGGELLIGPRPSGRGTRVTCVVTQPDPAPTAQPEHGHG
ncbi:MAG: PAS domain-containing protein [Proteobacteria bacterium]|nr:PAS domain-containing protein [Pseudomonadota bacterium]